MQTTLDTDPLAEARAQAEDQAVRVKALADQMNREGIPITVRTEPHPRDLVIKTAGQELEAFLKDLRTRHTLSAFEYSFLVGTASLRLLSQLALAERDK